MVEPPSASRWLQAEGEMVQQRNTTDYTPATPECQTFISYLAELADHRQNKASVVSLERRRLPRNDERLDAAIEALDEVENEIEAALRIKVGFDTSKTVDFLDALNAAYLPEDALRIANGGKFPELAEVVAVEMEPKPVARVVVARDDMRAYLMM